MNLLFRMILISLFLHLFSIPHVLAEGLSSGVAEKIGLMEESAFDGAIVCSNEGGFGMCKIGYSPSMYGVVVDNPAAYFDNGPVDNGRTILNRGVVTVRVNDSAGSIKRGDYITSSDTPGVGVKAERNGYVLGTALEDVKFNADGATVVSVAVNIHPEAMLSNTRSNLISVLKDATTAPLLEPLAAFRYVLAALLVIIAFSLGFIYFGKMATTGVEAIGRNPLAEKQIRLSVFLHVAVTIIIVGAGLLAAYIVLVL